MVLFHKVEAEDTDGTIVAPHWVHDDALSLGQGILYEFVTLSNDLILRIKNNLDSTRQITCESLSSQGKVI